MDKPAEDGSYHYRNQDLEFSVVLPPEFIYYQTQRLNFTDGYSDIEFFVPTSDTEYPQSVPGYARPIVVRVFEVDNWDEILEGQADGTRYRKFGEGNGRIYTVKFWPEVPRDWQDKWSRAMADRIYNSLVIE